MITNCSCGTGLSDVFDVTAEIARVELKKKNMELEAMTRKLNENETDKENILTSIVGSWSIVSSIGMEEYIQKWEAQKEIDAIFQVGTQNFEIEGDLVTIYNTIGITEHWRGKYTIGVKKNGARVLVDDNKLVSIYFADDSREEYMRLERFVKNGQLHVVTKRFGLNCTRVYERVKGSRIAELEAELKKINLEITADKETQKGIVEGLNSTISILTDKLTSLKVEQEEEKKKLVASIKSNVEIIVGLNETVFDLTDDLEKLAVQRDNEKKKFETEKAEHAELIEELDDVMNDLMNEREESKKLKERYEERNLEVQDLVAKLGKLEMEQKKQEVPIETSIIGTWRPVGHSLNQQGITTFTMENGNLIEKTTTRNAMFPLTVTWAMNTKDHEYTPYYFANTFVENTNLITVISNKNNGKTAFSVKRSIENDLLTIEIKNSPGEGLTTTRYKRVV